LPVSFATEIVAVLSTSASALILKVIPSTASEKVFVELVIPVIPLISIFAFSAVCSSF